jgi:tRNA U38,U39,U40 pseudouridine synthase TruA
MHDLMRFCGLFVGFDDFTNYTTAESFRQSIRVALGVSTLKRVFALTVKCRPIDFHSCPFALAMISRA